jgi:putative ubiquitin-RnfH superfamily antitoxin RatB of RatAB toxin-antitoxin module
MLFVQGLIKFMGKKIQVEVAFAAPDRQSILKVSVAEGTSIFDGAVQSGIDKIYPEIDFESADMGIFGKSVKKPKDQILREGDRVEIYRPLLIDPKQARLNRAAKK